MSDHEPRANTDDQSERPPLLHGVRVLDLTRMVPGPFATLILADLGADVIKIEHPAGGDPERSGRPRAADGDSFRFGMLNRGKRSMVLDLTSSEDAATLRRLAKESDVLLEGFRPGVMEAFGMGPEALAAVNPRLIYCSLSGYGQVGSRAMQPGHDVNYLAFSGVMGPFVHGDTATLPWLPISDLFAALTANNAILAALVARERSGVGERLDISMAESALYLLQTRAQSWLATGVQEFPQDSYISGAWPGYGVYQTRDGGQLSLGVYEEAFWDRLCVALDLNEYRGAQRDVDRRDEMQSAIRAIIVSRDRDDWYEFLSAQGIPVAPVLSIAEALSDREFAERGALDLDERAMRISSPIRPANAGLRAPTPAPRLGEHNAEILGELSRADQARARSDQQGTVGRARTAKGGEVE